jgi:hypothetical protein
VSALRVNGRDSAPGSDGSYGAAPGEADHSFASGAAWVCEVLVPAIERGNAELQPENIAVGLNLNLDPRYQSRPRRFLADRDGGGRRRR